MLVNLIMISCNITAEDHVDFAGKKCHTIIAKTIKPTIFAK